MLDRVAPQAAERWGDATWAVAADGSTISYRELARRADAAARGLVDRGVGEGDVVLAAVGPVPEHWVLYLAAARIGAVTAAVNHRLTEAEQARLEVAVQPRLALHAPEEVRSLEVPGPPLPVPAPDPERPVAIVFTSGTTGIPKGAVFAARQFEFITRVDTGGRWGGGGVSLAGTSLAHLGPMTKLAGSLMRGGTVRLLPRWRAAEALALTAEHRMTQVAGIPTQVALMLDRPDFDRYDLSAVRVVIMGGGPATADLVRRARDRFGAPVTTRYACTEAGVGLGTSIDDPPEDAEVSVGRPHGGVELALRDPEDPARPVLAGDVGEVCLRSPAQMSGYWNDPAGTAAALSPDGFVRTGDLGRIDSAGRLVLVGRSKEMFVRGGYNVYPMEVEAVLAGDPAVAAVAVVGVADDTMGEIGVAVVVAAPGARPTLEGLRAGAAGSLAHHKLPERLLVVDHLPLTAMDKVDRRALVRLVEGATAR